MKGTAHPIAVVLKPYSTKSLPRLSILPNIPPALRNYYLLEGVISSWFYYSHPPRQCRKISEHEALESQGSKHPDLFR